MPIQRTPIFDDDGSGTTGTILNNAWKQELYGQIDASLAFSGVPTSGNWIPTVRGSTGGLATLSFYHAPFLRIGPLVRVGGRFLLTSKGGMTGQVQVHGLPFAALGLFGASAISVVAFGGMATTWAYLVGEISPDKIMTFRGTKGAQVFIEPLLATDVTDGLDLTFGGVYHTSDP